MEGGLDNRTYSLRLRISLARHRLLAAGNYRLPRRPGLVRPPYSIRHALRYLT